MKAANLQAAASIFASTQACFVSLNLKIRGITYQATRFESQNLHLDFIAMTKQREHDQGEIMISLCQT